VANASGSERCVFLPCNSVSKIFFLLLFRVSASVFSVKFRVNPWQMLLLMLPSVANSSQKKQIVLFI
jgi:hypothetical protein